MYLVYLDNRTYRKVKSVAEGLATDDHKVRYRNPRHFSGPGEFKKADKVFVFGDWPEVVKAAKTAKVPCEAMEAKDDSKADNVFNELPEDTEFPYHYGGGNYFLSNGERVSGKSKAIKAQEALNETDDA